MLLKECPRCFTIVKGEFDFCIYCGLKLRIRSNSKEMEKTIVKKLTSKQNLKTQGLSFCNECGALMFPDKVNYKLVMKCKCGFTKPFDENKANSYKISSNIKLRWLFKLDKSVHVRYTFSHLLSYFFNLISC